VPTISITTNDYAPEVSDGDNQGAYLQRCSEALVAAYPGYICNLMVSADSEGGIVRQLQVTIPDENSPGGKRPVMLMAPEPVIDVGGDVMSESAFNARYGGGA